MLAEDWAPSGPSAQAHGRKRPLLPQSWPLVPMQGPAQAASGLGLRCRHHTLLAMVHTPEAVKLSKVHVGLDAAVLAGRERVGRPRAEEAPIRAGAAALGVRAGGLQGQGRALAAGMTGRVSQGPWLPAWGQRGPCFGQLLGPQASDKGDYKSQPEQMFPGADEKSHVFFKP